MDGEHMTEGERRIPLVPELPQALCLRTTAVHIGKGLFDASGHLVALRRGAVALVPWTLTHEIAYEHAGEGWWVVEGVDTFGERLWFSRIEFTKEPG